MKEIGRIVQARGIWIIFFSIHFVKNAAYNKIGNKSTNR